MSSQLKKRNKKRKKKKQEEEEIGAVKHERIGNLNYFSEEIAKNIIEKVICLAVNETFAKKIERKFAYFCYDLLKSSLDNINFKVKKVI